MNIIGIESSCDETSVSIISRDKLLVNLISSQDFHKKFGGVIPELSSRAHLQIIVPLVKQALLKSNLKVDNIDLVCATAGPGLIGALLVGYTFAKGLAFSLDVPFIPVNHIGGHIFSSFLTDEKPDFPFLSLVVSGGHTLLLLVKSFTEIEKLGTTIDDAAGEAFDKVAKMLGLNYPGGPLIQKYAEKVENTDIKFPVANLDNPYNFSFSGLKTSVLRFIEKNKKDKSKLPIELQEQIAFAFQDAVKTALIRNTEKAIKNNNVNSISLVGGVAANKYLRNSFIKLADKYSLKAVIPDIEYCGDNAAMIAFRGKTLFENKVNLHSVQKPFAQISKENSIF